MATKNRVDPITLELAQRWSGFVNQYTPYGLSSVHDEPSWDRWVQQMKKEHGIEISNKYYYQYRHAFEEAGGYDAFANIPEDEHRTSGHTSSAGHGGPEHHAPTETTGEPTNPSTEFSLPREVIPTGEAIGVGLRKEVIPESEPFGPLDGKDTADEADRFLRTRNPSTPTADEAQAFLHRPKNETLSAQQTPEQIREKEKKEAAEKILRRFFKENPVNFRRALVQKHLPTDPRYSEFTKNEQFAQTESEPSRELGDTHAASTHNDARERFFAYHTGAIDEYYKKERSTIYKNKREDPMLKEASTALQQSFTKLSNPSNTYYDDALTQVGAQQAGTIGREVYLRQFVENFPEKAQAYAQEDALIRQALEELELEKLEEDSSDETLPLLPPLTIPSQRFPHTQSEEGDNENDTSDADNQQEERQRSSLGRSSSPSRTRDQKQEAADQSSQNKEHKDIDPQSQTNKSRNPFTRGRDKAKNAVKKGVNQGKEAAKNAVKQGAKKMLKEGAKQLVEKGLAATAEFWVPVVIIIILILLLIGFIIVLLGAAGQSAQQNSASTLPVTITKTVNKTEMQNPASLSDAERLLTYTITVGYGGQASGITTTDPIPTGTTVSAVSGNPTFYDANGGSTTDMALARKVVWGTGGVGTSSTSQEGKGGTGGSQAGAQKGTVVQIGDSLTYGMHLAGIEERYKTDGWTPLIPGDPTSQGVGGCAGQVAGYPCHGVTGGVSPTGLEAVQLNKSVIQSASVVVIEMGTNQTESTVSAFQIAMTQMIDSIRAINPTAKIYWVNIASPINVADYSLRNQAIYSVAAGKNITVIDWYRTAYPTGDPKNMQEGVPAANGYLSTTDVHPSGAGYQALSDLIVKSIGLNTGTNTSNAPPPTQATTGTINNLGFGPSDATRIETMIKKLSPSSPMITKGQTIIDRAKEYNIDPLMIIVTRNESQMCSDNGVVSPGGSNPHNYNCGGIIWDAAQIADTARWKAAPGPSANGHVFTFVPTIEDGIGLFFNYIAASKFYNGKTLPQFYTIYNPCADPGNQGKFACGESEANNMLAILKDSAGPAADGTTAFTGTSTGTTAQKIGTQTYTITLSVNKETQNTYIINQATTQVVGAATTTTTTTTPTNVVADKPAGWPTNGIITQGPHGSLDHDRLFRESGGWESIDIANSEGTPLYATFDGKVKTVHDCQKEGNCAKGYYGVGSSVILTDEKETFTVLYGHMSQIDVAEGSIVKRGDQIGRMGNTGVSSGSHVHWEFRGIALAPPYIPQAITPGNCDPDQGIPCSPSSIQYAKIEAKTSSSAYWFMLHRKSKKEDLFQGAPGDSETSTLVKSFTVNTGVSGKSPTPLPRLAGRQYWTITKKQINTQDVDKAALGPYFLILDIPYSNQFNGPLDYKECSYTTSSEQCQWPTPGAFGLHGVGGISSRLTDEGSSGTIRHTDPDITELYKLLSPVTDEIRYYILDD